jgi:hypothetical protein
MSDPFDHSFVNDRPRGPYGANVGDIWSAEESEVGKRIKAEKGGIMIHEVFEDGEKIYWVEANNPDMEMQDLIRRAREGTRKWVEAVARGN